MRSIVTIIILLLFSLNEFNIYGQNNNENNFLIKQIKSKKGWYIIYAVKNDSLYKIVSKKVEYQNKECTRIQIGRYYNFIIQSNIPVINGVKLLPMNYLDVKTPFYDKKSVFSIEPEKGLFDSYQAKNLWGLCLIN
jgi:hypothetical protein